MKLIIYLTLSVCLNASTSRILTYNLLNYEDEDSREDDYISIVNYIEPDLIVAQEVIGQSGYDHFISDVLNVFEPGDWSSAPFTNQSAQQDIVLYYHHDIFSFVSTSIINTASSSGLRDVVEFIMVHESSGIEFRIYGVHLKASSGSSNASERLAEVTILRDYLNELDENSHFMVVGDFNIYSNSSDSEPAFDMLTGEADDNDGRLFDPIDRIGHWHNNSSYSDVHTQSPRTTQFGGGANGGMDDRFDWLFVSDAILDNSSDMRYVEDTYWAVGNDGNHFNDAINNGNNSSVNNAIANALHDASDHLPVYMDVWFDDLVYNDAGIVITEIMPNPASVSDSYGEWIEIHNTTDSTINIDGWTIKDADNDEHIINNDAMYVPVLPGEFFVFTRNGDISLNGGVISNYEFSGVALSNSEDEIILLDHEGSIVDEVHYTSSWAFGSGESMEIHNLNVDNNVSENWNEATLTYGNGDLGTPGTDYDGTTVAIRFETPIPDKFKLFPPYPNPFNPITTINYLVGYPINGSNTILMIYNIQGRLVDMVDQGLLKPGSNDYKWNAQNQPSGVYFIRLIQSGKHSQIQKVVLIK
jgi:endonuclease/exonuclease/phosphatase family metal-dependent hydrolase